MRLVSIGNCSPGMVVGKPIYTDRGIVLIAAGVSLTDGMINRLKRRNISVLYVRDKFTDDLEIEDGIPIELRAEANIRIKETFDALLKGNTRDGKKIRHFNIERLQNVLDSLIKEVQRSKNVSKLLTDVYVHDDYTYTHCTNVTIYSLAMAMELKLSRGEINIIGMGAMLHDIGKILIPKDILNKPGRLTPEEFDVIKTHTEFGWEILRNEPSVYTLSANCAYQHHEKLDGTGYPRGLKGNEISTYARHLSIADVFDALTSNRVYRKAMLPHEAMEILYAGTYTQFDPFYLKAFQKAVATYPVGVTVTLSTGETAVVTEYLYSVPDRPTVRVIKDSTGNELENPYELALSKELSITITDCDAIL
ncbi:HD-GYP domain-containing protein [Bacillus sp. DNRA2]|uniref:HD-GYP domain-containing protein n=1 Tax=Bacillus sp. DNRA2 TaxID=2723053 RepID=UPI00145DD4B6|nr:HD-GYP domain-containing protein [Bacillus sp. DNRA2]NMD71776.1 HD-GYP domain-containing protein [Bacillus sp. DNRA2]